MRLPVSKRRAPALRRKVTVHHHRAQAGARLTEASDALHLQTRDLLSLSEQSATQLNSVGESLRLRGGELTDLVQGDIAALYQTVQDFHEQGEGLGQSAEQMASRIDTASTSLRHQTGELQSGIDKLMARTRYAAESMDQYLAKLGGTSSEAAQQCLDASDAMRQELEQMRATAEAAAGSLVALEETFAAQLSRLRSRSRRRRRAERRYARPVAETNGRAPYHLGSHDCALGRGW